MIRSKPVRTWLPAVVVAGTVLAVLPATTSAQSAPECAPATAGGPIWVTAECVDPDYAKPVIDNEVDLTTPITHRKVTGHFEGTDKRFAIYLPPKDQWQGRFYHSVYPLDDENVENNITGEPVLAFGAAAGAYTVQTNGGGGYRVDAAASKFAKTVAAQYYGHTGSIYGYVWGGSGGSFQTTGAMENTTGVWDGGVPFILGNPQAIPNYFFIRALGSLVLADVAPAIADAVAPGGSGDPSAGLDDAQRTVLTEMTKLGVPLRAWEDYEYLLGLGASGTPAGPAGLLGFGTQVRLMDPNYADEFWSEPGYLGTEQSPLGDLLRSKKVDREVGITQVLRDGEGTVTGVTIDDVPHNPAGTALDFTVHTAEGATGESTLNGTLDAASNSIVLADGNPPEVLAALEVGGKIRIDNRWWLALPSYPRHQVPARAGLYAFDQYRNADGTPRYPQRPMEIGPAISRSVTGGGTWNGKINGKVIAVCNLLDADAFPWDCDWYSEQVRAAGNADSFRLLYNDNADHIGARTSRLVGYFGVLQQALRDVAAWAETGRRPPKSTVYDVRDGQITVPNKAAARKGIQPVVEWEIGDNDRIEVSAGQPVDFRATIQIPPGTGQITATEWDFTGSGDFVDRPFDAKEHGTVRVGQTFAYDRPGTYFAAVRVTSQRDPNSAFERVPNLARVRVVVR
ncbi:hypothetical protein ACFO5K_19315 [Nocardia halotolerans]|uniref:PKD domain-containing protein n=1 Tax=Nocardia halotolerans TaxID=1755878 RepID=A0ABV8VJN9_9NOCA